MKNTKAKIEALIGLSLFSVGLAGCSTEIPGWKIIGAAEICAQRGGIDRITNFMENAVVCRDGFFSEIKSKP